jgi:hypothetical protein
MNFITHLPNSYDYDAILVIIDRLIKIKHFIYCKKTYCCKVVLTAPCPKVVDPVDPQI